jgi:hypothetical protein
MIEQSDPPQEGRSGAGLDRSQWRELRANGVIAAKARPGLDPTRTIGWP